MVTTSTGVRGDRPLRCLVSTFASATVWACVCENGLGASFCAPSSGRAKGQATDDILESSAHPVEQNGSPELENKVILCITSSLPGRYPGTSLCREQRDYYADRGSGSGSGSVTLRQTHGSGGHDPSLAQAVAATISPGSASRGQLHQGDQSWWAHLDSTEGYRLRHMRPHHVYQTFSA